VLRTLVEAELAARHASNVVNHLKTAGFPVTKTLESFDVAASSIPPKVFNYLTNLERVRTQRNLAIIGPARIGKSHTLIGVGSRFLSEQTTAVRMLDRLLHHATVVITDSQSYRM